MPAVVTASLQAEISGDKFTATLIVPAGFPAAAVTTDACTTTLQTAGVLVTAEVAQACRAVVSDVETHGTKHERRVVVARAVDPVDGQPGRIDWLIVQHDNDIRSHYDRCAFTMVRRGQVVAAIIDPTPPRDGHDVTGQPLSAKPGAPVVLQFDETLVRDSRGRLVAQIDGALDRSKPVLRIRNLLHIRGDVDFSTGNIDFIGDVIIDKGVRDRFVVRSGGSVHCNGVIEAATIECLGDLTTRGMAGRERGTATTASNLHARYLDNVTAFVGHDLCVEKSIVNCETIVHGSLKSPRATLIGGRHTVTGPVTLFNVGSPANVPTHIILGTVPRLDPFYHRLVDLVTRLGERQAKLQEEHQMILQTPSRSAAQQSRLAELGFEISRCSDAHLRGKATLGRLRRRMAEIRTVHLSVSHVLHLGVVISICGQHYRVREDFKGPLTIEMDRASQPVIRCGERPFGPLNLIAELKAAA